MITKQTMIHRDLKGSELHVAKCNVGTTEPSYLPSIEGELYYDSLSTELYIAINSDASIPIENNWQPFSGQKDLENMNDLFLAKDNEDEYVPTGRYNPATKDYVDSFFIVSEEEPVGLQNGVLWYNPKSESLKYYFEEKYVSVTNGGGEVQSLECSFLSSPHKTSYEFPFEVQDNKILSYTIYVDGIRQKNSCLRDLSFNQIEFVKPLPGSHEIVVSILKKI